MPSQTDRQRPNILFITSDEHRWDAFGAYRRTPCRTPNLDRLAADGVLFDRAYTVNPLCSPSRVSMITSMYPSRHGVYTLGVYPPDDYNGTVGGLLARSGYATGLIGKAHFRPCGEKNSLEGQPKVYDLDFWRNWHGPYYGFDHVELCIAHTHLKNGASMHYGAWLADNGCDVSKYWGRADQGYCDVGRWDLPEEFHNSRWVADRTIDFIDRTRAEGKPFFAFASFQDPHNPVVAPEPWFSMYDRDEMPDYTLREGENENKPPFYAEFIATGHYHNGTVPPNGLNGYPCSGRQLVKGKKLSVDHAGMDKKENRQEAVAVYYGMISLMDRHIGRIVEHLKEIGQYENTLIVFTSDHGEYLGNHGLWWKGLQAYEDIHRLPFVACWPNGFAGGRRSAALQSLVDLAPTFLTAAGVSVPDHYQGVNQLDVWKGAAQSARDWAMVEFRPNDSEFYQKVLIGERYKLVTYHRETYGELYDLEKDPDQYENLWDDPASVPVKNAMLLRMFDAEIEKEDRRRPRPGFA